MYDTSPTTQDALSMLIQNYNDGLSPDLHINDEDFEFGSPEVNTDVSKSRNTKIIVAPTVTTGQYRRISIYYNRIDLSLITGPSPSLRPVIKRGTYTKVADIIPLINEFFGINLVARDYVNADLANGTFNINAAANSLMFIGAMTVTIQAGSPAGIAPAA